MKYIKAIKLKLAALITLFGLTGLLIPTNAYADFRTALEAYQNRDGTTMLAEVKDAVNTKNDDGLMLLLMATSMDAATSDYDKTTRQSKSTLRAILPPPLWDEMRELLVLATNNSSVDTQYYLNAYSQFSRELLVQRLQAEQLKLGKPPEKEYSNQEFNRAYSDVKKAFIDKGVVPSFDNSVSNITKQAEAGDPYYQAVLGFFNLGFSNDYAYQCEKKDAAFAPLCEINKDEVKGYEWLKKAIKGYEQDGLLSEGYGNFAANMCKFLMESENPSQQDLRQAYLWGFMAANLGAPFAEDWLGKMHRSGKLKSVAPQLSAAWDTPKRNEALYVKEIKEWPDLVLEARRKLTATDLPVFAYLFVGVTPWNYGLEVYSDGRVYFKDFRLPFYKTILTKVSPGYVKDFLSDVAKTGIDNWPLFPGRVFGCSECRERFTRINLLLTKAESVRRLLLLARTQRDDISIRDELQIARIKALVDGYFPTRQLRVDLGNGGKLQIEKLTEENKWIELARKGE